MVVEREFQVKKTTYANPCGRREHGQNVGVAEGRERGGRDMRQGWRHMQNADYSVHGVY